jgi:glycosyltransferase involved in cell wall biosynthesis
LVVLRCLRIGIVLRLGNPPADGHFYRHIWRWWVNSVVDVFVCNSMYTKNLVLHHGVPREKVRYIYNTAPSRTVAVPDGIVRDYRKIIYVGQIIPEKGVDLLIEAFAMVIARGYDASLDIVGDMDSWEPPAYVGFRDRIRARTGQSDLLGRVQFLGSREDVPVLLAAAGVHCCPSRPEQREGFGIVNIEAKQAGAPSIVSNTGALPELITHLEDGWICTELTPASIAEGLQYFLDDLERIKRAGKAARNSAKRFNREKFSEAWEEIFSVVCARGVSTQT